ncbi:MAG TPA: cyclic nucleotide-binding domain-containing protein [Humisphaera sp.]
MTADSLTVPTASKVPADLLAGLPLFSDLKPEERAELAKLLQPRVVPANETLFWIGEPGDDMYVVEAGRVSITYTDDDGREVPLAEVGPGQFFGELSLLDGGTRTGTARAADGGATLLCLGREPFHAFLKTHPSAAIHVLTTLGRRQRESLEKLRSVKNANDEVERKQTPVQRAIERVARVFSSAPFLLANLLFIAGWIVLENLAYQRAHERDPVHYPDVSLLDQPPTFFFLGFMVTVESLLLSIFVLNAQKRQGVRDAVKADLDYQVNRKAQLEIMKLHEKIDRLARAVEGKRE